MNKEYENFCRKNRRIVDDLLLSLQALLNKFEQGIIPGEPEKSEALYMLNVYKDALELFYKVDVPIFKRVMAEKTSFDEETIYKELSSIKESVPLLVRLGREKLIEKDDPVFKTDAGKTLLQGGFCDELILNESGKSYYTLSAKAEKTLKNKNISSKLRKDNVASIIPNGMIVESEKWNNIYVKRVEFLKKFYSEKRTEKEYILFTLDPEKEMVFACELGNAEDVTYIFAGVFDEKIDDHISQLISLSNSGLIDNIEIIVSSFEMIEILESAGIDKIKTPHISIEQL